MVVDAFHARCTHGFVKGRFTRPPRRRCCSTPVRTETASSPGAARSARARIEDARWVTNPGFEPDPREMGEEETRRCGAPGSAHDTKPFTLMRRPPPPAPLLGGGPASAAAGFDTVLVENERRTSSHSWSL